MEWLLYVIAAVFFLLGAVCTVLVVIQLPGAWILLGIAGLIEWLDHYYLPEGDRQTFGWWVLGVCLALLTIGEIIEFVAGALGAKKGGSSRRGMWGALIGGIVGAFVFMPLFSIVPFVGTLFGALLGAVLGTFIGAIIGEMTGEEATIRGSMKPAIGATIGRVIGSTTKVGIAIAVWLMLSVSAFWP
ncbi:MAG: DUF456 domain-containing protein [Planctomycetota bacterium]|jgi:uncharacterized protein YqgC (DUF456 family)